MSVGPAIGAALAAFLGGAGLGYMQESTRAKREKTAKNRDYIGKLLLQSASSGDASALDLINSPDARKYFDPESLSLVQMVAQSSMKARQSQEAGLTVSPAEAAPGAGVMPGRPGLLRMPTEAPMAPAPAAPTGAQAPAETFGQVAQAQLAPPAPTLPHPAPPEAAPAAPVQAPAAPKAAPEPDAQVADLTRQNYLRAGELKPGVGLSEPLFGGGTKTTKGADPKELGRRLFEYGAKKGYSYDAMVRATIQKGYEIPEDVARYGAAEATRVYTQFLQRATGGVPPTVLQQKEAARFALSNVGTLPEALRPLIAATKEDEQGIHSGVFQEALNQGQSIVQALKTADATGMRRDDTQLATAIQNQRRELIAGWQKLADQEIKPFSTWAPEYMTLMAGIATGNQYFTEAERREVTAPAPLTPEMAERKFEAEGRVPRLSEPPRKAGGEKPLSQLRQEKQAEEVTQAGRLTGERTAAERAIPSKPVEKEKETAQAVLTTGRALAQVRALYSPAYVGFGKGETAGRLKEKYVGVSGRESAFRAAVFQFRNQAIRQLAGSQVTGSEAARVELETLNPSLPETAFRNRMGTIVDALRADAESKRQVMETGGVKPPDFGVEFRFDLTPKAGTTYVQRFKELTSGLSQDERTRLGRLQGERYENDPTIKDIVEHIRNEMRQGLVVP